MNHYFKKLKLSRRQREIIIGTLLGDAHLETLTHGHTYRLRIAHSESQKEYIDWLYSELQNCTVSPPHYKTIILLGKKYGCYWFDTVYSGSLRFYAHQFYDNKLKKVPKFITRLLTPLGLAVWYMDDGSIKSHQTKGRILNTQGFTKQDVSRLIECLAKKFSIQSQPRRQKEGWQIFIPSAMHGLLQKTIGPYILPSMRYKLD